MSFRKEKKFRLSIADQKILKMSLINLGMKFLYPRRKINSCYFDTKNLAMLNESEEGILPRKKIRLRWYDNQRNFKKEVKTSSNEGRFKTYIDFNFNNPLNFNKLNFVDNRYGKIYPVLLIKYTREYFFYKDLRLTFDSDIFYEDYRNFIHRRFFEPECVMEIKTSMNISEDYLDNIIINIYINFLKL